jgi:DNA-binding NarL/FixJ family response regulator
LLLSNDANIAFAYLATSFAATGKTWASMATIRVLIAGDDDKMRKRMVVLLCRDHQLVGVVTNKELVQTALCTRPDVIVCDISTRMEGLLARKRLIAQGKIIPFVFVARESTKEVINVLWNERSFAFVCRDETSKHLSNLVDAVHNMAIYDSPFYPHLFDQSLERQNLVFIEGETLRKAEQLILSCEGCNSAAEIPFCEILDRLTGSDPSVTDYILQKPGCCPKCFRAITEITFVESVPSH